MLWGTGSLENKGMVMLLTGVGHTAEAAELGSVLPSVKLGWTLSSSLLGETRQRESSRPGYEVAEETGGAVYWI